MPSASLPCWLPMPYSSVTEVGKRGPLCGQFWGESVLLVWRLASSVNYLADLTSALRP